MTFVVSSSIIVAYDRSELRAARGLGRQVQEVRLHDQLPRHRPSDRTFSARQCQSAPHDSVIVTCSCCWAAYRYSPAEIFKGAPGPNSNCYDRKKLNNQEERKSNAVLLIAASLIAAVRLNREEIKSSPVVYSKIADSIRLAEMIQARLRG
jgi:hypothetical protein